MLDLFHLPSGMLADVQIFTRPSTVTNLQWMTWMKPRGRSMLHAIVIGGGAGGGGGFTRAAAAAGGGGGGGGSSAVTRVTIPLIFVPDVLYIQDGSRAIQLTKLRVELHRNTVNIQRDLEERRGAEPSCAEALVFVEVNEVNRAFGEYADVIASPVGG
jgi:hypothetical protein